MDKIVILEPSSVLATLLAESISAQLGLEPVLLKSIQAANTLLSQCPDPIVAAVTGFVTEDSSRGETLELFASSKIPFIVWSSNPDWRAKADSLQKNAVAYVLKKPECIGQVLHILRRIIQNRASAVLIVEDSDASRLHMVASLRSLHAQIYHTKTAEAALHLLATHPHIRVVLTDHVLEGMNGLELTTKIRQIYPFYEKSIIGLSASDDEQLSVSFLMHGANDFLKKPFQDKELLWRVLINLELLELIAKVEAAARTDPLTGIPNRRAFFERATQFFAAIPAEKPRWLAILDIDHFKSINDTYGHAAGDAALQTIAKLLQKHFASAEIAARIGGEEFAILGTGNDGLQSLEDFRKNVEQNILNLGDQKLRFTVSGGISTSQGKTFSQMMSEADELLYQAKRHGRNRIHAC